MGPASLEICTLSQMLSAGTNQLDSAVLQSAAVDANSIAPGRVRHAL